MIKTKAVHSLAGLVFGLVCYAIHLSGFILLQAGGRGHQYFYWLMPLPTTTGSMPFAARLQMLWQFNRTELLAILFGLPAPPFFLMLGWWLGGKRPVKWLHRWYVQAALAGVSFLAVWIISDAISFMLPFPLL